MSGEKTRIGQFILLVKNVDYVRELFQENRIDTSTSSLILLSNLEYEENRNSKCKFFTSKWSIYSYPSLNQKYLKRIKNVLNSKEVLIN